MAESNKLTRSESDRLLVGVCGGLGEHVGIDATIVRIGFVLLAIFGGSGVVLYLALWLIVPRETSADAPPRDAVSDSVSEGWGLAKQGTQAAKRNYRRMREQRSGKGRNGRRSRDPKALGPGGAATSEGEAVDPDDDRGDRPN